MLHFNTAILEEAGVDSAPTTFDELRAAVEAVQAAVLQDVSAWGATTIPHPNLTGELTAFILGNGGDVTRDGEWTLLEPAAIEGAQLYRDLASIAPPGLNGAQYRQLMADGRVALAHDGNWVMAFFDDAASEETRPNLQVAASPFDRSAILMGTGLGIPTDIDNERKELAWEFIQVAAEEEFQAMWAHELSAPPGRAGVLTDELIDGDPGLAAVADAAANAVSEFPDSANYLTNFGEIDLAIQDAVMRMLTSDISTEQALEDLQGELAAITEP